MAGIGEEPLCLLDEEKGKKGKAKIPVPSGTGMSKTRRLYREGIAGGITPLRRR
jgi:hypothetical protein